MAYLRTFIYISIAAFSIPSFAQNNTENPLVGKIYESYDKYKADFISHRRFKHAEVMKFLDALPSSLRVSKVGASVSGKNIKMVSYGDGEKQVLLWSQMHGNEPTASMALMDIFNLLTGEKDGFDNLRNTIKSNLTVHFIPMLNPDGADKFVRRNNQGVDINRDALRQQTPEGMTLKKVRDSLDADWGFNLHDQGRNAYVKDKPATISVLAPAYDYEKSINEKRGNAMQLIALMNAHLQQYIPGQVSQYNDDFEPRAFGDNIQKWGTRTILIESGGYVHDRDKQVIRKFNYLAILMALQGIANQSYNDFSTDDYFAIPRTNRGFRDLIVKNIQLPQEMGGYLADVAYNFSEIENSRRDNYYLRPNLVDIGDLSTSGGYIVHDASEYEVKPGKTHSERFSSIDDFPKDELLNLIKDGITDFVIEKEPTVNERNSMPVKLVLGSPNKISRLQVGDNPSLLFYKNDKLEFVLVNGYYYSPNQPWEAIVQGIKKL